MIQKNKILVLINTVTLVIMLLANVASNTGYLSPQTVADISYKYNTLFAPAGYAFIIWGFLFLLAIAFVVFQWILLWKKDPNAVIKRTGIWLALSNIANAAWVYCWVNERLLWCVVLICFLLLCLVKVTARLRPAPDEFSPGNVIFVWWPVTFYLGWIMVATIACVAAWLVAQGWYGDIFQQSVWTIIMMATAFFLYLFLMIKKSIPEPALVGIWAFIAIAVRQWDIHAAIAVAAILASIILLIAGLFFGYRNKGYYLFSKMRRGK